MYHRRSKFDPLWNAFVVGGVDPKSGEPTLGYVDLLGTTYTSPTIGTGYASMIAIPLLRRLVEERPTPPDEVEALDIIKTCMKVLFYRDARSLNKVRFYFYKYKIILTDFSFSSKLLKLHEMVLIYHLPCLLKLNGDLLKVLEDMVHK